VNRLPLHNPVLKFHVRARRALCLWNEGTNSTLNRQYYCEKVLDEGLLPDIRAKYGGYRWALSQQNGAPSRIARSTMQLT